MSLLLILLGALGLWWWLNRSSAPAYPSTVQPVAQASSNWLTRRLRPPHPLSTWLTTSAPTHADQLPDGAAADLVAWVATVNAAEFRRWEQELGKLARSAGFELRWLWGDQLNHDPDLQRELANLVLLSSLLRYRTQQAAPQFAAAKTLQTWRRRPLSRRQRPFVAATHAALVRCKQFSVDEELLLAPERQRHQTAVRALQQFDQTNPRELRQTVAALLQGTPLPPAIAHPAEE